MGPRGRSCKRERVCAEWRKGRRDYYGARDCKVEFDDDAWVIKDLDCSK
jgi:hypothetical protein